MPASFLRDTQGLEKALGYCFKDRNLLSESLTHKSYLNENPEGDPRCNERLEFLGDSVLGIVIAEALFLEGENLTESDMSKIKSYLVNEAVLFHLASELSLGSYLMLGRGEEASGGRSKRSVLSDAMEALFGAVFLDGGYGPARSLILGLFRERMTEVVSRKGGYDFKSELQEKSQAVFGMLPEYMIVKQEGEDHKKVFTSEVYIDGKLYGRGSGKSKKEAQMSAAKEAVLKLSHQ